MRARRTRDSKQKSNVKNMPKSSNFRFLRWMLILTSLLCLSMLAYCFSISDEIPSLKLIENPKLGLKTVLYSRNSVPIGEIYKENRTNISFDQLPDHLINALVATEDRNFWEHSGIDVLGFTRAVIKTVINKISGGRFFVQQGGGTITMQAARLLYTGRAGTIKRKLLEMMIALKLERTYSKREILEIFFNKMFYGHRSDGIKTAAETYFNKSVDELNVEESAVLVGLLQRPSKTNPITSITNSKRRRDMVLYFMSEVGSISKHEKDSLQSTEIQVHRHKQKQVAQYFRNRLDNELKKLGEQYNFDPYSDGLQVFTTLDTTIQNAMDSSITKYIDQIQAQSLARSKTQELRQRYLNDSTYTSKEEADSVFQENHVVQYGFITIDHRKGEVLGHLGGRPGYFYDHVFRGVRQPGSLIKPFVYATALNNGETAASRIQDLPYVIVEDSLRWAPKNWDNISHGIVSLRTAIQHSYNQAVLNLQNKVGGPRQVRNLMKKMGFTTRIKAVESLPLGVNVARPIELVAAYGAFANGGTLVENHTIQRILDKHGNLIYEAHPSKKEVLNERTAYILTTMLQSVVNGGSAGRIRSQGKVPYDIQVAAKTGTTNDHTDIWTAAYTPRFTTLVWLGLDNPKHKINLWSSKAVPIIGEFIRRVYEENPQWEHLEFPMPKDIVEVEIYENDTGFYLSSPESPNKRMEYFRKEFAPSEYFNFSASSKKNKKKRNIF